MWDPFLMKKLLKSGICGLACALFTVEKSTFAATVHEQCMNSSRTIS